MTQMRLVHVPLDQLRVSEQNARKIAVSSLLGHSSVATTERHYAPWNLARSERLGRIVRKVHRRDPLLLEFTPKKPARTAQTALAEAGLATAQRSQATRRAYA